MLVAPPGSDADQLEATLCESIAAHRHRLGGSAPDENTLHWLGQIVSVEIPASADSTALLAIISGTPRRSAVGVLDAQSFASNQDEDWSGALHALTEALAEALEQRELYVILDTAMPGPRGATAEMLVSGRNCALFGSPKLEPRGRLEEAIPGWRTVAAGGNVAPVLAAIEELRPPRQSSESFGSLRWAWPTSASPRWKKSKNLTRTLCSNLKLRPRSP